MAIDKIDLEKNMVKMMRPYEPTEPLTCIIDRPEKGKGFARSGGKNISNTMMVSK